MLFQTRFCTAAYFKLHSFRIVSQLFSELLGSLQISLKFHENMQFVVEIFRNCGKSQIIARSQCNLQEISCPHRAGLILKKEKKEKKIEAEHVK